MANTEGMFCDQDEAEGVCVCGNNCLCPHNKGLTIDPCCADCGYANAAYFCVDCNKKIDREEWEYEHGRDWDDYSD